MKLLKSKYGCICHKTGTKINKGDLMYYDYRERKVYCKSYIDNINVCYNTKQFIEAQENAYFDQFISLNYNSHENR
jgi:hypothetical protein